MKILAQILLVGSIGSLCACSTTSPHTTAARDLEEISDFNRQYLEAINSGNGDALSNLTEDDMVTIEPNWKAIEGKAANDKANRQSLQLFKIKEEWAPVETVIDGNLAYQRGTFTEAATPRGGGPTRITRGNYLRIYRRSSDGTWRMTREMTSSDQPMTLPRARSAGPS
jgi:ketosteroid isomerase-like protein